MSTSKDGIHCDRCGEYIPQATRPLPPIFCTCKPIAKQERFFLGTDNSSHWYLVPVSKSKQFFKWAELDEDDPKGWETPDYVRALSGSPCNITFTDPKENA